MQADQAKFLRIRVEMQIDKPLRRGGILRMMKVKEFGLTLDMRGCLASVLDVEFWGMMKSIAKQVHRSIVQKGNMVNG